MGLFDRFFGSAASKRQPATPPTLELQGLKSTDPAARRLAANALREKEVDAVAAIAALAEAGRAESDEETQLAMVKALGYHVIKLTERAKLATLGHASPLTSAESAALTSAMATVQYIANQERQGHAPATPPDAAPRAPMAQLTFRPDCPLCGSALEPIQRPAGLMTSGSGVCPSCRQQVSFRVSPSDNKLYVRMLTLPVASADPGEVAWDPV